jgi:hypothetical protein
LEAHINSKYPRGRRHSNPFLWGLRLAESPSAPIKPSSRSNYARELEYADRHDVHWRLLDCFLAAAGPYSQIRLKLDKLRRIDAIALLQQSRELTVLEARELRGLKRDTEERWAAPLKQFALAIIQKDPSAFSDRTKAETDELSTVEEPAEPAIPAG